MKRTKSMIYKETEESRELVTYATNIGTLYESMITPVINSLRKKYKAGIYNKDRAIDIYYRIATEASRMYFKEFGYSFSVRDRYTAAVEMEDYYREEICE